MFEMAERAKLLLQWIDDARNDYRPRKVNLSQREEEFIQSMEEWIDGGKPTTEKQLEWLEAINEKLK